MTALTANLPRTYQSGNKNHLPMVADTIIFEGAAVGVQSSTGYARPLVAGDKFVGFAELAVDNRKGAAAALNVGMIEDGEIRLTVAGLLSTSLGAQVFATDDNTFTLTPNNSFVGYVKRYVSSGIATVSFDASQGSRLTPYIDPVTGRMSGIPDPASGQIASILPSTWEDINVPLQQGCTTRPVYRTFIDAVNGNDAWDGTVPVWTGTTVGPKRTAVVGNWTGSKTSWFTDEILLFAAGQTHTLTATGASIGLTSRKHLGAYWLPTAPNAAKPIIKSLNNTGSAAGLDRACISASGTLTDISISDLTIDTSDVPNRFGISMYQTAVGQSINNITFSNVSVIGGTITDTAGYGGIGITYYGQYATLSAYPVSKNILYQHCDVVGYPGFGFVNSGTLGELLANGRWHGVDLINCVADGCGAGWDTHGFTSYSGGVLLDQTSGGWTNTTSTIYYMDIDGKYGRDIPDIEIMHMDTGVGTEMFKLLKNTATPTTPAVGEFGYDATGGTGALRLYANFGAVLTVANRFSVCVRPTKGVRYIRCTAIRQKQAGRSGADEGHGFAYDDFTSNCSIIECASINNLGAGITINRGDNCQIVASYVAGNRLVSVKGNFGWGHYIGKCDISGVGNSATAPPNKGFFHIAHASHKAYGPNGAYAGALAAPNTYVSVIANTKLKYTGTDATVALVLGPSSASVPPLVVMDCELDAGVGYLSEGRAIVQGRSTAWVGLPNQVRGLGAQA